MATMSSTTFFLKALVHPSSSSSSPASPFLNPRASFAARVPRRSPFRLPSCLVSRPRPAPARPSVRAMAVDGWYSSRRGDGDGGSGEPTETMLPPGCDYNHWLILMEFPEDPAPTREEMIEHYLNALATVLDSMEEAEKSMYAFSTTTYTGFRCLVDEETAGSFRRLPWVSWVFPDSCIALKSKDYGVGDVQI